MNIYFIFNIKLNLFSIEIIKKKEILVKIKNRLLHLKNKVKNMLNYILLLFVLLTPYSVSI